MRCKPNDLAIVVGTVTHDGWLVEVIAAAPVGIDFTLPNGQGHGPCGPGRWIIRSLGSPFTVDTTHGVKRITEYGVGADHKLRPLPGLPVHNEQHEEIQS